MRSTVSAIDAVDGSPKPHVERRLAAILAADVAGYSRLMGADEEGTHAALQVYRREIIDPKIAEHHGRNVPFAFDRKESKDHGEGGNIVGSPLAGRVVIVDDVISDGAAKRAAIELIRAAGAQAVGVLLALDREERGNGPRSAVQEMEAEYGVRCVSILTLSDLVSALSADGSGRARISAEQLTLLRAYRDRYGVT